MTKILYLTPIGRKLDLLSSGQIDSARKVDLDEVREVVLNGMNDNFDDVVITEVANLIATNQGVIALDRLREFDVIICDLTTRNPNVMFEAGRAEGLGKAVVYILSRESAYPITMRHKRILSYSDASLRGEFQAALHEVVRKAISDPDSIEANEDDLRNPKVFISYSHQDREYLDRLNVHLKPLAREGLLDIWQDTRLKTGDEWKAEIEKALSDASIAILLISADFLASDFIVDNELPPLLSKAEVEGTRILPLIVSPCRFSRDVNLSRFQATNGPKTPLSGMVHAEREAVYDHLMSEIELTLRKA